MKNWQTTTAGVLGIISILSTAGFNYFHTGSFPDWGAAATGLVVSLGLIRARDSKPTDLTVPEAAIVKKAVATGAITPTK